MFHRCRLSESSYSLKVSLSKPSELLYRCKIKKKIKWSNIPDWSNLPDIPYIQDRIVSDIRYQASGPHYGIQADEVRDTSNWDSDSDSDSDFIYSTKCNRNTTKSRAQKAQYLTSGLETPIKTYLVAAMGATN